MNRSRSFYFDAARIALSSIRAHKLRAFLTLIGIIIGVASVVVVGAAINGLNTYVVDRVSSVLGANHFMIARGVAQGNVDEDQWEQMQRVHRRLETDDFAWVAAHCTRCLEVGAQLERRLDVQHKGEELLGVEFTGVTANMERIEDKTIDEGRFLLPHEIENAALVTVIGAELREKFFEGTNPLGQTIKFGGLPFRIVGIEKKRGSMFGQSLDKLAYVPLTTFQRMYGRRQSLQIHGKGRSREEFPLAIEEARTALRNYHKLKGSDEDTFGLVNTDELNNSIDEFTGIIALVVTPVTLISLVVGGIVVMNIMLVSVTERTFEIGLRKALGATRRQILSQFLIESFTLATVGGMFGLIAAAGISALVSILSPMPMTITIGYILLAIIVSGGIGIIAGVYPAYKAARLDPVIALTKTT